MWPFCISHSVVLGSCTVFSECCTVFSTLLLCSYHGLKKGPAKAVSLFFPDRVSLLAWGKASRVSRYFSLQSMCANRQIADPVSLSKILKAYCDVLFFSFCPQICLSLEVVSTLVVSDVVQQSIGCEPWASLGPLWDFIVSKKCCHMGLFLWWFYLSISLAPLRDPFFKMGGSYWFKLQIVHVPIFLWTDPSLLGLQQAGDPGQLNHHLCWACCAKKGCCLEQPWFLNCWIFFFFNYRFQQWS